MKRILLPVLLLCVSGALFSIDFGFLMEHEIEATDDLFYYSPSVTPWFSWDGGKGISLYASGIMFLEYNNYSGDSNDGWGKKVFKFDLARTALSYNNNNISLEAGRVKYADALEFTAASLYDGARFRTSLSQGTINAGLLFSGLQYKETAMILMTGSDTKQYYESWEGGISNYVASSRLLATGRWDMPLFGDANTLSAEFLMQFDLNGEDDYHHSQYVEAKYEFYPIEGFGLNAGAIFEIIESNEGGAAAFGFLAGMGTKVPGALNDWVNAYIKFTTGHFSPINSIYQGEVFQEPLSGLMVISGDYSIRIAKTIYTEAFLRYYIKTYGDSSDDSTTKGNFYGGELWGSVAWQPVDDIRFTVGGGLFFPGMGNALEDKSPMWKVNAVLTMSF